MSLPYRDNLYYAIMEGNRSYPLVQVTSNKSVAPKTFLLLDNLDTFMKGTIFGNAFFSVLEPHSSIPSHCGPTNLRVRCHLGIQVKYACDPGWSTIPGHKLALERMGFFHWINLQRSI